MMIPILDNSYTIIDISQGVSSQNAPFPGDCPFSYDVNAKLINNDSVNLTSFKMSSHIGTHVDAYSHIIGSLEDSYNNVGNLPLEPFIGEALVLDLGDIRGEIDHSLFLKVVSQAKRIPQRLLIKTSTTQAFDKFNTNFAYLTPLIIDELHKLGVCMVGVDSPSVDKFDSKNLLTHHKLIEYKMFWLENLNLANVSTGVYFLIAPPLKFFELEASPLRAVLLDFRGG